MRADIVATPSFTLPGLRDRIYDLILARISDPWIIVASARAQWARERKIDLFLHQTTTPAGKICFRCSQRGHLNERGQPFSAASINSMLR